MFFNTDNPITDSMMKLPLFVYFPDRMMSAGLNGI